MNMHRKDILQYRHSKLACGTVRKLVYLLASGECPHPIVSALALLVLAGINEACNSVFYRTET